MLVYINHFIEAYAEYIVPRAVMCVCNNISMLNPSTWQVLHPLKHFFFTVLSYNLTNTDIIHFKINSSALSNIHTMSDQPVKHIKFVKAENNSVLCSNFVTGYTR